MTLTTPRPPISMRTLGELRWTDVLGGWVGLCHLEQLGPEPRDCDNPIAVVPDVGTRTWVLVHDEIPLLCWKYEDDQRHEVATACLAALLDHHSYPNNNFL